MNKGRSPQDIFDCIEATWPSATKRLLRPAVFEASTAEIESLLSEIAESGELRWAFPLLGLAIRSRGDLQAAIIRSLDGLIGRLTFSLLIRLDEFSRPGYMWEQRIRWLRRHWDRPVGRIDGLAHEGFKGWCEARSLDAIIEVLGDSMAILLLASMHREGRIRQAAVRRLEGFIKAVGALLIRANDWVAPVREDAAISLHRLATPEHRLSWIHALPLVIRLEVCGRTSHAALLTKIGSLYDDGGSGREALLNAIQASEPKVARAAAAMALRIFGREDRDVQETLLASTDVMVRLRTMRRLPVHVDRDLLDLILADPVPGIRRQALDLLRQRDEPDLQDRLRQFCFDVSQSIREYARYYLQKANAWDQNSTLSDTESCLRRSEQIIGALGCLYDLGDVQHRDLVRPFCEHERGKVRLLAKRCLIKWLGDDDSIDGVLLDDNSPKVTRRIIALLRDRGRQPDLDLLWSRVVEAQTGTEVRAWLNTLAQGPFWDALPYLVRALDYNGEGVGGVAWSHIQAAMRRVFSGYVNLGDEVLGRLGEAIRSCSDNRTSQLVKWIQAVTPRKEWQP